MNSLVICEKPSVAKDIAKVIGANIRKDGYFEGNSYIVSWCVGHLLGLAEPQSYDEKYAKWRYDDLPILPENWKYEANNSTKKQLVILVNLMKRSDVDIVINACDAGREGELIMRLVYDHARCNKKMKRLWVNSMEQTAIEQGFKTLIDSTEYDNLYRSALCRQQADWTVGMNLSRLFSVLYNATLRVGRVQTPTLAMIVEREDKIANFVKEPYYVVTISNGELSLERERLKDKEAAESTAASCNGKTAVVTKVEQKEKTEMPPKLYDLTTLQREANRLFGYTAAQTLENAQSLYEKRLITYPRSDSRYLTHDMAEGISILVKEVSAMFSYFESEQNITCEQVINDKKVSDHHAIIPTTSMPNADLSELSANVKNILDMVCTRLVATVAEKHKYSQTVITVECESELFTAKGKTIVTAGWKAIEEAYIRSIGKEKKNIEKTLPNVTEGQSFTAAASVREGFTKPPQHYTEDLILSAMETVGAKDMPDDAERKGLGTPATRAAIIENLVKSELLVRKDKNLLPTIKGINLIRITPESVKSPMMTAQWETLLKQVEHGELTAEDFMKSINEFVSELVKTHSAPVIAHISLFPSNKQNVEIIGKCPRCGNNVVEKEKGFFCDNRACKFGIFKDNRFFAAKKKEVTKQIAAALVNNGKVFVKGFISDKTGKAYDATVVLDSSGEGYPSFRLDLMNS